MAVLQIVGNRPGAGKTSLAGALLLHLTEGGRRVAYYKSFSPAPSEDPDVSFFSTFPAADPAVPAVSSPHPLPASTEAQASLANQVKDEVDALLIQKDFVLVEGPDLTTPDGAASTLPIELSALLDSRVLVVFQYSPALDAADVLEATQPLGDRLAGVIINGVTAYRTHHAAGTLAKELQERGIPMLGSLPEDRAMLGLTVQQIAEHLMNNLGGRWVQEAENTAACVERFLIGGNIMDAGPTYFGRYSNQAVITRAARPDIQMACLMSDIKCLVLTEGDDPIEYVKAEALQRGVPLISVEAGTMETAENLGGLLQVANARSRNKIERFLRLIRDNLDQDKLALLLS